MLSAVLFCACIATLKIICRAREASAIFCSMDCKRQIPKALQHQISPQVQVPTPGSNQELMPGLAGWRGLARCLLAREYVLSTSDNIRQWKSSRPPVLLLPVPGAGWDGHLSSSDKQTAPNSWGDSQFGTTHFRTFAMLQRPPDWPWVGVLPQHGSHHVVEAFRILGVAPSAPRTPTLGLNRRPPIVIASSCFGESSPTGVLNT